MAHTSEFDKELIGMDVAGKGYGPDKQQQKAISSINNTVVAAGAGSGKTEVLARRFAYLLMTDPELHVKNILAITFTKKAAAEIYARVYRILSNYRDYLKLPVHGGRYEGKDKPAELAARAIKEFSDARIQTLDSYTNDIVKSAVARYGIKPDFATGTSGNISRQALKFAVEHMDNPDFAECYSTYVKVGKVEDFSKKYISEPVTEYTSVATKNGWFSLCLQKQVKAITEGWNNLFVTDNECDDAENLGPDKAWRLIKQTFPVDFSQATEKLVTGTLIPLQKILSDYSSIFSAGFSQFKLCEKDIDGTVPEKCDFLRKFLADINKVKSNTAVLYQTLKPFVNFFMKDGEFFNLVSAVTGFFEYYKANKQLCILLDKFLAQVNDEKRISGNLTFKDINELAMTVLDEQEDILKEQQNLIQKIMIDEFQDNNRMNMDLLVKIAGNSSEKLFFVGDEKQSIYKFRGADVSVFNGLKNNKELIKSFWMMNNNYRSSPQLLKAFNELFGQEIHGTKKPDQLTVDGRYCDSPSLFWADSLQENEIPEYEALYLDQLIEDSQKSNFATKPDSSGNDVVKDVDLSKKENIKIHACVLNSGKNPPFGKESIHFSDMKDDNVVLDENETAAYFLAAKIRALKETGKIKNYSDCAILDCSRTHRPKLQHFLSLANIPFSVDVQKNIFSEGILNDFYNFLRICVYPNDTVAFSSFLVSPFVNMSVFGVESLMAEILSQSEKIIDEDGNESIRNFTAFDERFENEKLTDFLSASDKIKLAEAKTFYETMRKKVLSSSITSVIQTLWYDTGYFYETKLSKKAEIAGEQFDLLYQIAIQAENQGENIQWFIDQLAITKQKEISFAKNGEGELETDDVHYPLEKSDAVTIMTIHQSKGLEFEYVFVTGIFDGHKTDKQTNYYYDVQNGVSFKPGDKNSNYFYLIQQENEKNKALAEQKRIIYVAFTRAKKGVYFAGDLNFSDKLKTYVKGDRAGLYNEGANPSIMHKILRYYYEGSLYKNNEYNFNNDDDYVPVDSPVFNPKASFDFYGLNPVPAKARWDVEFFNKVYKKIDCSEIETAKNSADSVNEGPEYNLKGPVKELSGKLPVSSSPSGLEKLEHEILSDEGELGETVTKLNEEGQKNCYSILDKLFDEKTAVSTEKNVEDEALLKQDFHAGTFGNMVHSCMEHWVNTGKLEEEISLSIFTPEIASAVDDNFNLSQQQELFNVCTQMTKAFAESELGRQVIEAKNQNRVCKAENEFKMNLENCIFNGAVDLFFENPDGTFTLVDYKTDAKVNPSKYFEQQACYRYALEKIYNVKISECWLYFTRYEKAVKITSQVMEMTSDRIREKLLKFNEAQQK